MQQTLATERFLVTNAFHTFGHEFRRLGDLADVAQQSGYTAEQIRVLNVRAQRTVNFCERFEHLRHPKFSVQEIELITSAATSAREQAESAIKDGDGDSLSDICTSPSWPSLRRGLNIFESIATYFKVSS